MPALLEINLIIIGVVNLLLIYSNLNLEDPEDIELIFLEF